MTTRASFRSLLLMSLLFLVAVPAGAQNADEIFARLKAKYDSITSLRAEFSQTMSSSYMDEEATSNGVLVIQGDRYRVETEGQTLVTDGEVTWVYMASQKQVLINDHSEDEQSFSISDFLFNYDERFTVAEVKSNGSGADRHFVLSLKPKAKDTFFTEATLSMRERDNIITSLQVVDVNGTKMIFKLTNIEINPSLGRGVFSFTPPQGTEVIDLRS
ncbi:MAG: outer membrane lipoprotein carrier protein LolA [Rhodothermales bacterium]